MASFVIIHCSHISVAVYAVHLLQGCISVAAAILQIICRGCCSHYFIKKTSVLLNLHRPCILGEHVRMSHVACLIQTGSSTTTYVPCSWSCCSLLLPHAADPAAAGAAPTAADAAVTEIHLYLTYYVECVALCGRGLSRPHGLSLDCQS